MNKEHPNISILKRFNPANPNTLAEVLAEDFVWHYINPKLSELEGDYFGLSGLTDFFQKLAGRTSGSFKVNPISIIPMGNELVITHVKDRMSFEGKPMEIDAIVIWCIIGGKIKEAWDIPIVQTAKMMKIVQEKLQEKVEITPGNAAKAIFSCIKNIKRQGFKDKVDWFEKCHKEGLRIKILKNDEDKMIGFVEYLPAKNGWRLIDADSYMFIHCTYIYSKNGRSKGYGSILIEDAEKEAKAHGMDGVCMITSKGGWLAN